MAREIILAGGMRTPFGDFGKSLKDIPLAALGIHATKACLEKAGLDAAQVDHLVWGNVLPVDQEGYLAARYIAIEAGLPEESAALNVNRACGSGTQAIISAAQQIMTGHGEVAVAGGGENFSRAPFAVTTGRWGHKRGPQTMVDTLDWAYRDPFSLELMGETAENLAEDFQYRREAMDDYAIESQRRAGKARDFLGRHIAPIEVKERRATRTMSEDESPRPDVHLDKLAGMRPVFRDGGMVTAGNSSSVTDGAAMVVVADRVRAEALGVTPQARIVDWCIIGVPPRIMGCGPVPAIGALLEKHDMSVDDVDYYEINEAFAVVNLHAERQLGVSRERCNLYGGGISLGHPPGATGARMTLVAMQHLAETGQKNAIISMCMGAGQGLAMLIERVVH